MRDRRIWMVSLLVLSLAAGGGYALAQEHPKEHPSGGKEHPAESKKAAKSLSMSDFADAVESYVKAESAKNGGNFVVDDPVDKQKLSLKLTRVHKERLAQVGSDTYFACADFAAADGTTYDLDIFMKGTTKDNLQTTEVAVHKKNGKERYTWYEENGTWKKKSVS